MLEPGCGAGGKILATHLQLAPPKFSTFRHHCSIQPLNGTYVQKSNSKFVLLVKKIQSRAGGNVGALATPILGPDRS